MKQPAKFHDVLGLAYEAALTPELWPQALEGVADIARADCAALLIQDQVTGKGTAMLARVDPAVLSLQFGYYATRNPVRAGRNRVVGLSGGSASWRTRVVTDEDALPKSELMRSEYYNDYLRPFGIHSGLMIGLALDATRFATVNLMRSPRRDGFERPEVDLAKQIQPHLIRAFELDRRLSEARQLNDSLSQSLDRSPHAVYLVDAGAHVRHVNRAGETLTREGRGLSLRDGVLRAATSDSTNALHQLVQSASEQDAETRRGGAISLARPGFRRPLSVIVAPLRTEQLQQLRNAPTAIIFVTDPESGIVAPEDRLRALFGFTAAEARVAIELLTGADPATIARHRSLSVNTVRVQIARIMDKTDTNRQSELVRLLERVSGFCTD
ncbi:MAG TPA: helix-turn-helix transcriptional regulator [Rhizomicrobium sp.]|jgi:DNA-binding CsgD family transcriptional regulator